MKVASVNAGQPRDVIYDGKEVLDRAVRVEALPESWRDYSLRRME